MIFLARSNLPSRKKVTKHVLRGISALVELLVFSLNTIIDEEEIIREQTLTAEISRHTEWYVISHKLVSG